MKNMKFFKSIMAGIVMLAVSQMAFAELSNADGSGKKEFKGRSSLYVTADTAMDQLIFDSAFDPSTLEINNLDGYLTFAAGKFLFTGVTGGIKYDTLQTENMLYSGGLVAGLSVDMAIIRPYVMGSAVYVADQNAILKIGGGLDIKTGFLMLTAGYNYNYKYDISGVIANYQSNGGSTLEEDIKGLAATNYHTFSVGVGITW